MAHREWEVCFGSKIVMTVDIKRPSAVLARQLLRPSIASFAGAHFARRWVQ